MILKLRLFLFIFSFIVVSNSVHAQRKIPPQKPTLIVQITIEQLRYDYLTRFWDKFGDHGFKELTLYGAVCKNAQLNHMFTQSAPGYACISTGAVPADHGIIADNWYDRLKNAEVNCIEDFSDNNSGSRNKNNACSPRKLIATTIGDELKFVDFKSKVVSIGTDSRAAILSAGHIANGVYWLDDNTGDFVTSTFYSSNTPQWLKDFNNKKMADLYLAKNWESSFPLYQYLECLPDKNSYEYGFAEKSIFPYNLMTHSLKGMKYEIVKETPFGNSLVKDLAINAIVGEELGKDNHTDIINIAFSATEYIGNRFGSMSIEMEDALIKMDKDIEFLLEFLSTEVGKEKVLVVLTSNHGAAHSPKYLSDINIPSGQFKYLQTIFLLKSYLNALYGEGEWVKYYNKHQIYLNHVLIENSKLSIEDVQQKAAELLIQVTGVANAVTATTLQKTNFTESLLKKMQNSFNQKLSGDILINLQPGWVEQSVDEVSIHNSAYSYDTHVPLIWYGWKIERQTITTDVSITDIAPTIANFINSAQPTMCTGKSIPTLIK